jgi:hypothetical protein
MLYVLCIFLTRPVSNRLKPSAVADMDGLRKYDAPQIADAMERHLQHTPMKESKSRIKTPARHQQPRLPAPRG